MIKKKTLIEVAYDAIKRKILCMEYPPGYALIEHDIADELGLSRTPVQTAFKLLEKDNLIRINHNRGAYVKEIDLNDIKDIFALQTILECYCVRVVAEKSNTKIISVLEQKQQESEAAFEKKDYLKASEYGEKIHNIIISLTGNSMIKELSDKNLEELNRVFVLLSMSGIYKQKTLREHSQIIEAIKCNDSLLAEKLMKGHLERGKKNALIKYVVKVM